MSNDFNFCADLLYLFFVYLFILNFYHGNLFFEYASEIFTRSMHKLALNHGLGRNTSQSSFLSLDISWIFIRYSGNHDPNVTERCFFNRLRFFHKMPCQWIVCYMFIHHCLPGPPKLPTKQAYLISILQHYCIEAVCILASIAPWRTAEIGSLLGNPQMAVVDEVVSVDHGALNIINTLRLRQNGRHFPDDTFKGILLNEKCMNFH